MLPFLSSDFRVVIEWRLSHHRIATEQLSHGDDTYSCIAIALALRSEPSPSQFLASALCSVFQSHARVYLSVLWRLSTIAPSLPSNISGSRPAFSGSSADQRDPLWDSRLPSWATFRFSVVGQGLSQTHLRFILDPRPEESRLDPRLRSELTA